MAEMTWAEAIESSSQQQQHSMGFGPFFVHLGELETLVDTIMRTPNQNRVPAPWPVTPAKGWLTHRLNDEWSLEAWCALGGEWVFQPPTDKKRIVHISEAASAERKASIGRRLDNPLELIATGEAFAFCDDLFVIPEESFIMNSWQYHVIDREPLGVFLGFRGHPRQYSEIITPGIYRAHNRPDENSARRYQRKARVASNVAKQAVFEQQNIVLTNVQARGLLQHYGIIGATDVLDLTFDVNVAKWFALNVWHQEGRRYCPKRFIEHKDPDKAYDEYSLVYTVVVRSIETQVDKEILEKVAKFGRVTLAGWGGADLTPEDVMSLPARNISPLWSTRAKRQSGFGLLGVGPRDEDAWGSVLTIVEHAFHPTFAPDGWDRIGGTVLSFGGGHYGWADDTSVLADHALPVDDECIKWIRANVAEIESRLNL